MSLGPSCIAETQACNDSTLASLIPELPDLHLLDLDMLSRVRMPGHMRPTLQPTRPLIAIPTSGSYSRTATD